MSSKMEEVDDDIPTERIEIGDEWRWNDMYNPDFEIVDIYVDEDGETQVEIKEQCEYTPGKRLSLAVDDLRAKEQEGAITKLTGRVRHEVSYRKDGEEKTLYLPAKNRKDALEQLLKRYGFTHLKVEEDA